MLCSVCGAIILEYWRQETMGDMTYFNRIEYSTIDAMLATMKPGKFQKCWALIMQYAHATEGGNLETPIPYTNDATIDGFLSIMCSNVKKKTVANIRTCIKNGENAKAGWDKRREKQAQDKPKQDTPKTKAPMTLKAFEAMAEKLLGEFYHVERVKELYNQLEATGWKYHGVDIERCVGDCKDCYKQRTTERNIPPMFCGMGAILTYNTVDKFKHRLEIFNAACEATQWLCFASEVLKYAKRLPDGGVEYKPDTADMATVYDSLENFAKDLKTSQK